jgi:hypothetical protein
VAALTMLLGWRIAGGSGVAGLDLSITVNPTGELQTLPAGPAFFADGLTPTGTGPDLRGTLTVRNRTGVMLMVRVRALPSSSVIDDALQVQIDAARSRLFSGSLGALRQWTDETITLPSGASESLTIRAWLAQGGTGYQGDQAVSLEFLSVPVRG